MLLPFLLTKLFTINNGQLMLQDAKATRHYGAASCPRQSCFILLISFFASLLAPLTASAWLIEADSVSLPAISIGNTTFQSVTFRQSYPSIPVVVLLPGNENTQPGALRIRNITTSGFEIAQTEPPGEDGAQPATIIHYIAVEPGTHQLPNGSWLEAGTISTNNVQHGSGVGGPESWTTINFNTSFTSQPAVIGQIQSMNNESGNPPGNVSVPWLTTAIQSVTNTSVQMALERSEVNDGGNSVANETIGYLAINSGTSISFIDNSNNNIEFETIQSAQNIQGWDDGCFSTNFSNSYSSTPLVAASANTHAGGDGGWLRRCSISTSAIGLSIDEDRDRDSERNHTNENAGIAVFSKAFDADLTPPPPKVINSAWRMETGEIVLPSIIAGDTSFKTINFKQYYPTAPLVFVLSRDENSEPASVRINNITNSSFEIVPVEPLGEDGTQPSSTLHYLAVEPGLHKFPDGTIIEALTKSTNRVQSKPAIGNSWETVSYSNAFTTTPAILTQIQTLNNETSAIPGVPSNPWLASIVQNVTPTNFQVALERAETGSGPVANPETIAYLAIEDGISGSFRDNDGLLINYEAIRSANSIAGWSDGCYQVDFSGSYTSPVVLASQNQRAGNNGGWIRRCSISGTSVGLTVDEDQTSDSERLHITERAGVLVFAQPFVVDFSLEAWWPMEEPYWDGTPNEVTDQRGNGHNGQATNGPTTSSANPAITGDPGTCGYGVFDGTDDYIELPGFPDLTSDFTITGWLNTTKHNKAGQRIFADDETNSGGYALSVGDPGTGRLRFYSRGTSPSSLDTPNSGPNKISKNQWYFVAAVADITNKVKSIYVYDSSFAQITNVSSGFTGTWGTDSGRASIGGETNSGETSYRFNGSLDEVRIYNKSLSTAEIVSVMQETHACSSVPGVDHYAISHSGSAITCEAEPVTFSAHDAAHTILTSHTGTINLSTSTNHGDWSMISGNPANLANSGNGAGTYTFDGTESGSIILGLRNTFIETVNINVTDGTATELTGTALASEDKSIVFFEAGFKFLVYPDANNDNVPDSATLESVNTQISGKQSNQGWNDQVMRIQAIKTDDQTGACVAALNSPLPRDTQMRITYLNPALPAGNPTLELNGKAIPTSWTNMTDMTFTAGLSDDIYLLYQDTGQLSIEIQHDTDGDGLYEMVGINNPTLTVRPFAFLVTATGNPAASLPAGLVYTKAGTNFTINTTAVQWQATDDTDNDGIADGHDDTDPTNNANLTDNPPTLNFGQETVSEDVVVSALLNQPSGGNDPGLSGTTTISAFIDGSGNTPAVSYNEVGIIEISAHVADGDYLGTGAITTSNIVGRSGYVGRFTPDHFILAVTNNGSFDNTGTNSSFTYLGETFNYMVGDAPQFTIYAKALGADDADTNDLTSNYTGDFNKISLGEITLTYPNNDNTQLDQNGILPINFTSTQGTHQLTDNGDGTTTLTLGGTAPDSFDYDRVLGMVPPFNPDVTISLDSINETDDTVSGTNSPLAVSPSGIGNQQRFGRAVLQNTFGPETENQSMPLILEYFDGTEFLSNDLDFNSTFIGQLPAGPSDLNCSDPDLTDPLTCVLVNVNNPDVRHNETFSLASPGLNNTGVLMYTLTVDSWLQFDWDNDDGLGDGPYNDNPSATAIFGIYRGNDRIINWREIVR